MSVVTFGGQVATAPARQVLLKTRRHGAFYRRETMTLQRNWHPALLQTWEDIKIVHMVERTLEMEQRRIVMHAKLMGARPQAPLGFIVTSVNAEKRLIEGIATTSAIDMVGDSVNPLGAKFPLPLPLCFNHDTSSAVGEIYEALPTREGIRIRARIAKIEDEGEVKRLCDRAWHLGKNRLIRGLSFGFRAMKDGIVALETGGYRFDKYHLLELSVCTIPANQEARIQVITP
jgi:HK97 family phage prohead protease